MAEYGSLLVKNKAKVTGTLYADYIIGSVDKVRLESLGTGKMYLVGSSGQTNANGLLTYSAAYIENGILYGNGSGLTNISGTNIQAGSITSEKLADNLTIDGLTVNNGLNVANGGITTAGDVVITGNLTVKGTTTTVDTSNLEISDKLLELGKRESTTAISGYAGIYVANYDGTNSGMLGFDKDGYAYVGDATITNGEVTDASQLQRIATINATESGIVKYDANQKTLIPAVVGTDVIDNSTLTTILSDYLTNETAAETYQPKGNYLTSINASMINTALGGAPLLQSTFNTEISKYITTETANNTFVPKLNFKANYLDANDVAYTSEIPTKVSELENDSGYLTEHQDLSAYLTSATAATTYQTIAKAGTQISYDSSSGSFQLKNESGQLLGQAVTIDTTKGVNNVTVNTGTGNTYLTKEKKLVIDRTIATDITVDLSPILPTKLSDLNNDLSSMDIPIASADKVGGIKVGAGLEINPNTGILSATGGGVADSVDWSGVQSRPFDAVFSEDFTVDKTTNTTGILKIADTKWATRNRVNSQGFLTEATIPSEYLTETEANGLYLNKSTDKTAIDEAIAAKLDIDDFNTFKSSVESDYLKTANLETEMDNLNVAFLSDIPTSLANPYTLTITDRNSTGSGTTNITYKGDSAKALDLSKYALISEIPHYALPTASSTIKGGIMLGYEETGRNYALKLSETRAYVTVPWTDTTYTAGTGLTLSGSNVFTLNSATESEIGGVTITSDSTEISRINGKVLSAEKASKDSSGNIITSTYQTKAVAVTKARFDSTTNRIYFQNEAGTDLNYIDMPVDKLIESGSYDPEKEAIILLLSDGSAIEIPVADLMVSYAADGTTLKLTGTTFAISDTYKSLIDNALQPGDKIPFADITGFTPYTLPVATSNKLGGVIVGNNISVDTSGKISISKSNVTTALGLTPVDIDDVNTAISNYDANTLVGKYAPKRDDYVYTSTYTFRTLSLNLQDISGTKSFGSFEYNPVGDESISATLKIIPTKTSQLTNDSGFLTSTNLNGYVTGSDLTNNSIVVGNGDSTIKTSKISISTTVGNSDNTIPTGKAILNVTNALGSRLSTIEADYVVSEDLKPYAKTADLPTVSITNGNETSGQYISAISVENHTITVSKKALPAIPTNYVTTNSNQSNLSGTKSWTGAHTFGSTLTLNGNIKLADGVLLEGGAINTHPEAGGSKTVLAYYENDLTGLIARGGSCVMTGAVTTGTYATIFSGATDYYFYTVENADTSVVTVLVKSFKNFTYSNQVGIGFGATSWTPKNVKIEIGYAETIGGDPADDAWKTVAEVENNSNTIITRFCSGPTTGNASSKPWNTIRITLSGFRSTSQRIAGIWVINYGSRGLYETAVSRNGSSMYGNLTAGVTTAQLGTTSEKWSDLYTSNAHISSAIFNPVNADVLGTNKNITRISGQLFAEDGIVFGGTAAAAGLVTRGICGVSVPGSNGTCNKDNLYINYDNDSTYRSNRQLILQAGTIGTHYGHNVYQYTAVRGDALVGYVTSAINSAKNELSGDITDHENLVASTTILGHIKLGSDDKITVSEKVYPVQLDENNKAYVSVPWTDSDTTYSAGTGLSLSGTTFSLKTATSSVIGGVTVGTISSQVNKINNQDIRATYDSAGNNINSRFGLIETDIDNIQSKIASAVVYKGTVANYSNLPTNASNGDMYNVTNAFNIGSQSYSAGTNVVRNSSTKSWDPQGGDTSAFVSKTTVASSSTLGLIKIGFSENGRNFPVELNSSNQAFVNVPAQDLSGYFKLNGNNTANGSNVFQNDIFTSGSENQVVKYRFKTGSNQYGAIYFGKEGPNNGSMIRLDQVEGTARLYFRASSTAGAIVWNQPEANSQLYLDVDKVNFRSAGFFVDNSTFRPATNNARDLGTSSLKFRTVYAVNFNENGTNLSSKYLQLSGGTITGNLTVNGSSTLKGTVTISGAVSATASAAATTSKYGFIKLGSDSQITASGKVYPVQLDSSDKAYVSVPRTDTDTKNTAGSTNNASKLFLIGATSQAANPQTYSNSAIYATNGVLSTTKTQVGGTAVTMEYNSDDECLDFIFA